MFKRLNCQAAGAVFTLIGAVAILAIGGCGEMDRTPLATEQSIASADQPTGTIVFGPLSLAKRVRGGSKSSQGLRTKSDDAWIRVDDDGRLGVRFSGYGNKHTLQVTTAKFTIRKKSMDVSSVASDHLRKRRRGGERVHIKMKVTSGQTLSDVLVEFGPHDLRFTPMATLEVTLDGNLDALDDDGAKGLAKPTEVYHVSGNGKVTKVKAEVKVKRGKMTIKVQVPSFSSWDWNDVPEAEGP